MNNWVAFPCIKFAGEAKKVEVRYKIECLLQCSMGNSPQIIEINSSSSSGSNSGDYEHIVMQLLACNTLNIT